METIYLQPDNTNKLNKIIILNSALASSYQQNHKIALNDSFYKKNKNNLNAHRTSSGNYLNQQKIRNMLHMLLNEKKIPQKMLAKKLGITTYELESILHKTKNSLALIPTINLPLIKLYCSTNLRHHKTKTTSISNKYYKHNHCRYTYI